MPKKIRPKGYRNRARQNRERMAQNSDDSPKVDELIARHVKGPESGVKCLFCINLHLIYINEII
jgi:hypothetical protein